MYFYLSLKLTRLVLNRLEFLLLYISTLGATFVDPFVTQKQQKKIEGEKNIKNGIKRYENLPNKRT